MAEQFLHHLAVESHNVEMTRAITSPFPDFNIEISSCQDFFFHRGSKVVQKLIRRSKLWKLRFLPILKSGARGDNEASTISKNTSTSRGGAKTVPRSV